MSRDHFTEDWKAHVASLMDRRLEEVFGDWLIRSFDGGYVWKGTLGRREYFLVLENLNLFPV